MSLIDILLPLSPDLPVYPGNAGVVLDPFRRIAAGASANVSRLELGTHSGTHIDAPLHFFDGAGGADTVALDLLIGRAQVVDLSDATELSAEVLASVPLTERRLLLKTRNSDLWRSRTFNPEYVALTPSGADYLVGKGVRVVGIDYLSIEQFRSPGAPVHKRLLGNGVVIIEGLDLSAAAPGIYELVCLPLRLVGGDGAPARAVLRNLPDTGRSG